MHTPVNIAQQSTILLPDSVFSLTSTWRLSAPIDRVWEAIRSSGEWPHWWRHMESVSTLVPGNADGVGVMRRFVMRSSMGYRVRFDSRITLLQAPHAIDVEVSGDLTGTGRWRLFRTGDMTLVRYQWDVMPAKPWMRRLAPYARSLFEWNHARIMRSGEAGLRHWLGDS